MANRSVPKLSGQLFDMLQVYLEHFGGKHQDIRGRTRHLETHQACQFVKLRSRRVWTLVLCACGLCTARSALQNTELGPHSDSTLVAFQMPESNTPRSLVCPAGVRDIEVPHDCAHGLGLIGPQLRHLCSYLIKIGFLCT